MIDLDLVEVGSKLTITTVDSNVETRIEFAATHNADKGYAVLLRATDGQDVSAAIDRKAAKMIINYLQTIYEL